MQLALRTNTIARAHSAGQYGTVPHTHGERSQAGRRKTADTPAGRRLEPGVVARADQLVTHEPDDTTRVRAPGVQTEYLRRPGAY
jgi:hypothetical protein